MDDRQREQGHAYIEDLCDQIASLKTANRQLQEQKERLQANERGLKEEVRSLGAELGAVKEQNHAYIENLCDQIASLNTAKQQLQEQKEQLQAKERGLKEDVRSLEAELGDVNEHSMMITEERNSALALNTSLRADKEALGTRIAQLESEAVERANNQRSAEKALADLHDQLREAKGESAELRVQVRKVANEKADLTSAMNANLKNAAELIQGALALCRTKEGTAAGAASGTGAAQVANAVADADKSLQDAYVTDSETSSEGGQVERLADEEETSAEETKETEKEETERISEEETRLAERPLAEVREGEAREAEDAAAGSGAAAAAGGQQFGREASDTNGMLLVTEEDEAQYTPYVRSLFGNIRMVGMTQDDSTSWLKYDPKRMGWGCIHCANKFFKKFIKDHSKDLSKGLSTLKVDVFNHLMECDRFSAKDKEELERLEFDYSPHTKEEIAANDLIKERLQRLSAIFGQQRQS